MAALGPFISRFTGLLKAAFHHPKRGQGAGWDTKYHCAVTTIKQYLTEPPILASPDTCETLYLYIAVSDVSVSAALFKEDEHRQQKPIFFISKSLSEAETRALALKVAAKKLRLYFQAHPIAVLTNLPLRSTIHKPDLLGRRARWAIEPSEFGIQFKPRLVLKGYVLADFLAEIPQQEMELNNSGWWTLNVDGAS